MRTTHAVIPALLLAALCADLAAATEPRWRPLGPEGGPLRLVAVEPGSPDVLTATVPSPLSYEPVSWIEAPIRSTDGGRSWREVTLPPFRSSPVMAFRPADPRFVYAAGTFVSDAGPFDLGIFRSTDGGLRWRRTGSAAVTRMVVSAANADDLYRTAYGETFAQRSTDAGASWQPLPVAGVSDFAFDSGRPGRLCAVTWEYGGVPWLTCADDPTGSWAHVSRLPAPADYGILTVDPTTPSGFELVTRTGVARSSDGGATWNVPGGEPLEGLDWRWTLEPRSATAFAHAGDGSALLRKKAGASTWEPLAVPTLAGCLPELRNDLGSLFVADDGATLYLVTSLGTFVSHDLGDAWDPLPATGRMPGSAALDPTGATSLFLSTYRGPYRSADAGASWQRSPEAETLCGRHDFLASSGSVIYAYDRTVLRSTDGGASWSRPGSDTFAEPTALAVNPSDPLEVFVASHEFPQPFPRAAVFTQENVLARSTDGGATFTQVPFAADASRRTITEVLFDPRDPRAAWAVGNGLFRRRAGAWEEIPLPAGVSAYSSISAAIAINAAGGALLLGVPRIGVFATRDDGRTWADVTAGLPRSGSVGPDVTGLAADPDAPGTFYLSARRVDPLFFASPAGHVPGGVFRTTDAGATWAPLGEGLGDENVTGLLLDRRAAPALVANTPMGAWALALSAPLRLDRIAPGSGAAAGGTLVVLTGDGFLARSRVTFGGAAPPSVELLDARTLRVRTPPHAAGAVDVEVENPDGASVALAGGFRYETWGSCREDGTTLCLEAGRFAIRARTGAGPARAEGLTIKSGWFWSSWNQNPDAVVKVLDGRSVNGRYWVSAATLNDEGITISVTDTVTGRTREFEGAPGRPLAAIDRETFQSD